MDLLPRKWFQTKVCLCFRDLLFQFGGRREALVVGFVLDTFAMVCAYLPAIGFVRLSLVPLDDILWDQSGAISNPGIFEKSLWQVQCFDKSLSPEASAAYSRDQRSSHFIPNNVPTQFQIPRGLDYKKYVLQFKAITDDFSSPIYNCAMLNVVQKTGGEARMESDFGEYITQITGCSLDTPLICDINSPMYFPYSVLVGNSSAFGSFCDPNAGVNAGTVPADVVDWSGAQLSQACFNLTHRYDIEAQSPEICEGNKVICWKKECTDPNALPWNSKIKITTAPVDLSKVSGYGTTDWALSVTVDFSDYVNIDEITLPPLFSVLINSGSNSKVGFVDTENNRALDWQIIPSKGASKLILISRIPLESSKVVFYIAGNANTLDISQIYVVESTFELSSGGGASSALSDNLRLHYILSGQFNSSQTIELKLKISNWNLFKDNCSGIRIVFQWNYGEVFNSNARLRLLQTDISGLEVQAEQLINIMDFNVTWTEDSEAWEPVPQIRMEFDANLSNLGGEFGGFGSQFGWAAINWSATQSTQVLPFKLVFFESDI